MSFLNKAVLSSQYCNIDSSELPNDVIQIIKRKLYVNTAVSNNNILQIPKSVFIK